MARNRGEAYTASIQRWDVALPVSPAMALAIGQAEVLAGTAEVYTWSSPDKRLAASDLQNPTRKRLGRMDLAFVITYLVPLLVIVLGYDLLASEREDGTLALVMSQPVNAATIVWAKVFARWAFIVGTVLISSAVAMAILGLPVWTGDLALRLCLMAAVVAVYVFAWLLLAAAANLVPRAAVTNAVLLTGVWLTIVMVVPSMLTSMIAMAHPVPPKTTLVLAGRAAEPDVDRDGAAALERYLTAHLADVSGLTPRQTNRVQLLLVYLENEHTLDELAGDIRGAVASRDWALARWAWLSPPLVMQEALTLLAGTDSRRYRRFGAQVDALVGEHREFFVPRIAAWTMVGETDAAGLPRFADERITAGAAVVATLAKSALLLVLPAVALLAVWRPTLRTAP